MGNAPVINIAATRVPPDNEDRYNKWVDEAYYAIRMRPTTATGIDRYTIVKESPDYNRRLGIQHFTDMNGWLDAQKNSDMKAVQNDLTTNWKREVIWYPCYELEESFINGFTLNRGKQTTIVDEAPIIHIAAFNLTFQDAEKYRFWFNERGRKIYIPILLKLSGIKAINHYRWTGRSWERETENTEYPRYLSIFYFENLQAYENYAMSPELAAFHEGLRLEFFPNRLDYKWRVTYQLTRSWRK
jgi:hypothetical protein